MLRSFGISLNGASGGNDDLGNGPARGPTHQGRVGNKTPKIAIREFKHLSSVQLETYMPRKGEQELMAGLGWLMARVKLAIG